MVVLLVIGLSTAYAGNSQRIGTAGAQELLIPVGSRGTAMGGSVVANTYGLESMYWNPAGLANLEGTEAMFTHLPYFADIDVNYVGIATAIEDFGTIGVGAKVVSIGDIEETTEAFPDGTGREFSPSLTVINLTYSRILTNNVSFGFSGMFINESIFDVSASGIALDFGFQYDPGWHGVKAGFVVKNYGPEMKFSGIGFEESDGSRPVSAKPAAFDIPTSINLGVSLDALNNGPNMATISGNFRANSFSQDQVQGGFEYSFNNMYFLRGGYNWSDQEDYIHGASLGAGLSVPMGDTKFTFEYSWNDTEVFDDNQFFSVRINF